jgi:hypothetical protein
MAFFAVPGRCNRKPRTWYIQGKGLSRRAARRLFSQIKNRTAFFMPLHFPITGIVKPGRSKREK